MIRLQTAPIALDELVLDVRGDGDGAVATFLGTVRDHNAGRKVLHLEYEAYGGMAEREMERIAADARERFGVSRVAIVHRTGRLEIGEASVAIAVAAPHRAAALDATRFIIDTLKRTVPIWKREHFEGGSVWVGEAP
ncbi:MAG TPA: molybdenum cofactor biosynthesis protein MoaE [Candidatus Bathyarchaeia archaeon]|nr:molybdenum cofactor biosynthesis protein MoaE [Candidatus Bathyarchaeia archaeon]